MWEYIPHRPPRPASLTPKAFNHKGMTRWLGLIKAQVQALFDLALPRPKGAPRPGLVPHKKVVKRGDTVYQQTYYVRPENTRPRQHRTPKSAPQDPPPLLALLEATKRLSPPAPERPKSSDALAGLPIPKEAEAALQAFPHYRPQAQDVPPPHEAREMLLREALKPGGYILHPEAPSTHAHNPTPLLEAWRLHLTRGERAVPALKEELAARLKRLAALWPKYQRAKDKQRRWELESLIHLEGSEVRRLGELFHHLQVVQSALQGTTAEELAKELDRRVRGKLDEARQNAAQQAQHLWAEVAPDAQRLIERLMGPRYLEFGGRPNGLIDALKELATHHPGISRGKKELLPRLERLEQQAEKVAGAWRRLEGRSTSRPVYEPRVWADLLEGLHELAYLASPRYLVDELAARPNKPGWLQAWLRVAAPHVRALPQTLAERAPEFLRLGTAIKELERAVATARQAPVGDYGAMTRAHILLDQLQAKGLAKAILGLRGHLAKAKVRNIPVSRLRWVDRPKEREKLPASHFLLPGKRKFPYKNKDGSVNCRLLKAAISRAAQHGYKKVEAEARRLHQRHCQNEA